MVQTTPLFYSPDLTLTSHEIALDENTSKHAIQVLRMKEGDELQLTNGKGLLINAIIISAHKKSATASIRSHQIIEEPLSKVTIAISPVKNNSRFEWFLEKATELGVSQIIPLLCKRTEKQHLKFERMQSILVSAMLQSQQSWLPEIAVPLKIQDLVVRNIYSEKYIAHCMDEAKQNIPLTKNAEASRIILIGPEGDFTAEELALALENNYIPVSLGNTRLRTETAGIVASVLLTRLP